MKVYIVCEGVTESSKPENRVPDAFTPQRIFMREEDACVRCKTQAIWSFGDALHCESPWLYYDVDNPRHKVFIKDYEVM